MRINRTSPAPDDRSKQIWIKGFCRNCWNKFDIAFPYGEAKGKDLKSLREWVGVLTRCCKEPDPRW